MSYTSIEFLGDGGGWGSGSPVAGGPDQLWPTNSESHTTWPSAKNYSQSSSFLYIELNSCRKLKMFWWLRAHCFLSYTLSAKKGSVGVGNKDHMSTAPELTCENLFRDRPSFNFFEGDGQFPKKIRHSKNCWKTKKSFNGSRGKKIRASAFY